MIRKSIVLKGTKVAATEADQRVLNKYLSNYEIYEFPEDEISYSLKNGDFFDIEVELFGHKYQLEVFPNEIRTDDFQSSIDGKPVEGKSPCRTFKGNIKNTSQAVRLSINENGISGFVQLEDQKLFIEKSAKFKLPGSKPTLFVVYYQKDVMDKDEIFCGVTSEEENRFLETLPKPSELGLRTGTCKFLKIATEADYEYYQIYGAATNDEILYIINLIEGLYMDTFEVALRVTFQHVWTTSDPYTGDPSTDTGSELLVGQLRTYWEANFTAVVRDVVHLFTGVNAYTDGTVGRVYEIGSICRAPSNSYGFTKERFQAFLTTAHELGHNFGGVHTDGVNCGTVNASIMCQGMKQIPMYFSAASITRISNFIGANGACLTPSQFYRILGNSPICSSEVFAVANLLPTDTAVWSITPSGAATISGSGNSRTLTRLSTYDGPLTLSVEITIDCGTFTISRALVVGTASPYLGGTFNDGGSGVNQPLESTFNEVYHTRVYISLSGSSSEFTWDGFYTNGNVTWYHPVGYDGLIIDFGDPLPVYNGDYIGFSIHRTNACGLKTEPLFFYYNGPTQYYRITPGTVKSTFTVTQINSEQKPLQDNGREVVANLVKLQVIDKTGSTVMEEIYPEHTKSTTVDFSKLKSDTYLVRLFTKVNVEMYQVVV